MATATAVPGSRARIDRDADRRITGLSIGIGALFVAAGVLAATIGALTGGTLWMPLHLVLAGAAGTVIAGVLPFFTAALAVAPPADPRARLAAVGCIVVGAIVVIAAIRGGSPVLGAVGGSVYLLGLVLVAVVASQPLRGALGPRRRAIERAYLGALAMIVAGVLLATAMLAGWDPVVERWPLLKPAHVWLNLVGSLSLIVVATLTHLAPTIEGTRIRPRAVARIALVGIGVGAAGVAVGYAIELDALARAGAGIALIGAVAVPVHALAVRSTDDPWTTDPGWHRFATWSLRAASAWFVVGMAVMAGRVLWLGADPGAWSLPLAGVPLVIGWVLQVLVGSWSHLIPALGPGDPLARAVRRDRLGRAAAIRLAAFNAGVLLAWVGLAAGLPMIAASGGDRRRARTRGVGRPGGHGGPRPPRAGRRLLRLSLDKSPGSGYRPRMVDVVPLLAALERSDHRMTEPRRVVASLVADQPGHFAAADLVEAAAARDLGIGRATVFRTLDVLLELGLVERLDLPSGEHAYVACEPAHHHHVVCSSCGRSEDVDDAGLRSVVRDVARQTGYRVDAHRLELFGLCPACQAGAH